MFFRRLPVVFCLFFLAGCFNFGEIGSSSISGFDLDKVEFNGNVYPVVIIGGGVGGLTSAIYMSQANIKTLVLEGGRPGGALAQSHSVRNWPGEQDVNGADLVNKIKEHAIKSGAEIVSKKAIRVNFNVWPYEIEVQDILSSESKTVKALSCIIATGATANYLNIPGEKEYWGKGITNCAICDGSLYKNMVVGVVGGGDAAIEEANYLSSLAKKVYIFVRRDEFRATGKVRDEVISRSNVEVLFNTTVEQISGDKKDVTGVTLKDSKSNEEKKLKLDGLFLAVGSKPNSLFLKDQIELDSKGYVILTDDQQTSNVGIYAAGDIADPKYKQAISSAGHGCVAALQAQGFLVEIGYDPGFVSTSVHPEQDQRIVEKADVKKVKGKNGFEKKSTKKIIKKDVNLDGTVTEISSTKEFDEKVLKSSVPVVADFYAVWCGPCRMMEPEFKKTAKEFVGQVRFVKVNVDEQADLAKKFGVRGIPALMFFKDGEIVNEETGYRSKDQLVELANESFGLDK